MFFKPLARIGLGVKLGLLSDADKQRLQSNKGMRVEAVRKGSPAFAADILPGDIVISIGGKPTYDLDSTKAAVIATRGHEADYVLFRQSKLLTKKITVPNDTW